MQREERLWKSSSQGYNQVTVRENLAKASSPNLGQPCYPHSAIWPTVMFLKGRTEHALLSEGTRQHRSSTRENRGTWGDVKVQHSTTLLPAAGGPGCSWASRAELFPQPNFRKHRQVPEAKRGLCRANTAGLSAFSINAPTQRSYGDKYISWCIPGKHVTTEVLHINIMLAYIWIALTLR